jgi:hypothetical protein
MWICHGWNGFDCIWCFTVQFYRCYFFTVDQWHELQYMYKNYVICTCRQGCFFLIIIFLVCLMYLWWRLHIFVSYLFFPQNFYWSFFSIYILKSIYWTWNLKQYWTILGILCICVLLDWMVSSKFILFLCCMMMPSGILWTSKIIMTDCTCICNLHTFILSCPYFFVVDRNEIFLIIWLVCHRRRHKIFLIILLVHYTRHVHVLAVYFFSQCTVEYDFFSCDFSLTNPVFRTFFRCIRQWVSFIGIMLLIIPTCMYEYTCKM